MCGLILIRGDHSVAAGRALNAMSYRGADQKRGISSRHGWTVGHVRLAIQDLSDKAAQPVSLPSRGDGIFAFVGELFNHFESSDLWAAAKTYDVQGCMGFHQFDGFWSVVAVHPDGYAEAFTDHLGIKPLYYWADKGIVCSELDPMFEVAPAPPLDEGYLANCIKFGYDYSGRTPYKGIVQLPPGHRLCFDPDYGAQVLPYWSWSRIPTPELTPENLRAMLFDACSNRMISDRPVSLLLSGGLDSSTIYYILKELGEDAVCFSVENGESEFLPHGLVPLLLPTSDDDQSRWTALYHMQAPLDLGSMVPQDVLGQAVSAHGFQVVLSGDGADELFGGYSRAHQYDSQASDVFCELPYYHLPRLDRLMMRHTVELRSPFLAPVVVAMALRLPREQRIGKKILKDAMRGLVPDRIIDRPKIPLKTAAVREGGVSYRAHLVDLFRAARAHPQQRSLL